jgi:hypothetical protein
VRWIVTLRAIREDAERLAALFPELSTIEDSPRELRLEVDSPEGDAPEKEVLNFGRAVIQARVRGITGFGRLRWGRNFEGLEITNWRTVDADGTETQVVFMEPAVEHMLPEDFADMVERLGEERPDLPVGLDAINALDGVAVAALARTNADVARVLRLIDEMLAGDDEIDWAAAFSALEVIEQDLHGHGVTGQDLGWWTGAERDRFRGTANSVELLGHRARHGWRRDPPKRSMTDSDASWLVRRAAALWVRWLLEKGDASAAR